MTNRIHYTKPSITEKEIEYAKDAAANGWGSNCYRYINRFEELFKTHLDVSYAIATSSCTGAMHMGMHALGIESGDEVILADTNWIASVAPIVHLGAKPVFVDILENTWCLDPELVEKAITPKTKAIIAVHLYGNLCEMDELIRIGEKYNIPIIEDAAEAIGSVYYGRRAGSIGTFGVFSFHGTKTMTTGEGGIFVTNDSNLHEKVLTLSNHGRSTKQIKQFWPDTVGFKYKMSNIQAAIGCAQLERINELISRKQEILTYYRDNLNKWSGIETNPNLPGREIGAWMPTLIFEENTGITREILLEAFSRENIDARVFFWPLSSMDMFEKRFSNHNSYSIPARAINLPSYHDLDIGSQDKVLSVIENTYKSYVRTH